MAQRQEPKVVQINSRGWHETKVAWHKDSRISGRIVTKSSNAQKACQMIMKLETTRDGVAVLILEGDSSNISSLALPVN